MALVTEYENPATKETGILAVGRLSKLHGSDAAEFAMVVSDRFQCQGLCTELLKRLIDVGKNEKISSIYADILADNLGIQRVCEKLGFKISDTVDTTVLRAEIELSR